MLRLVMSTAQLLQLFKVLKFEIMNSNLNFRIFLRIYNLKELKIELALTFNEFKIVKVKLRFRFDFCF